MRGVLLQHCCDKTRQTNQIANADCQPVATGVVVVGVKVGGGGISCEVQVCLGPYVWQLSPWVYFCLYAELRSTGTAHHFAYLLNTSDYRILRMDEDHDRMYVGSKDHILSLDLHDVNKDPHIVSTFPHSTHPQVLDLLHVLSLWDKTRAAR